MDWKNMISVKPKKYPLLTPRGTNPKPGGNVIAKAIQTGKTSTPWFLRQKEAAQEEAKKPPLAIPVEEDPNKGTGDINFCEPGMMATCKAGKKWNDHKRCKYAIKNSLGMDLCRHYVMDEFCDNVEAQKNA